MDDAKSACLAMIDRAVRMAVGKGASKRQVLEHVGHALGMTECQIKIMRALAREEERKENVYIRAYPSLVLR